MSYDANIDDIWKDAPIAKNGVPFKQYEDLPDGDYVKSRLTPENDSIIVNGFRFVLSIYNGRKRVFKNPIKANDMGPNSPDRDRDRSNNDGPLLPQHQVNLSLQHVQWLEQAQINSRLTLESVRRIEKILTDPARTQDEQDNRL